MMSAGALMRMSAQCNSARVAPRTQAIVASPTRPSSCTHGYHTRQPFEKVFEWTYLQPSD
jgi:hypothetical protein